MIVVVGPSAAGKTTWCRRHAPGDTVPDREPSGTEPDAADLPVRAAFWTGVGSRRWHAALDRERASGLAVCDDDPLKLHYSWSLARIGAASPRLWTLEVAAWRAAIAAGRLGLADLVLVSLPDPAELVRRRDADPTRRRRDVAPHARLAGPLREWCRAWEAVWPGRVHWSLPPDGVPAAPSAPRPDRTDPAVPDGLVGALPRLG